MAIADTLFAQMGPVHGGEKAPRPGLATVYAGRATSARGHSPPSGRSCSGHRARRRRRQLPRVGRPLPARDPDGDPDPHPVGRRPAGDGAVRGRPPSSSWRRPMGGPRGRRARRTWEALLALVEGLSPEEAAQSWPRWRWPLTVADVSRRSPRSSGPCSRPCAASSRPRGPSSRRPCPASRGPTAAGDWPLSIDQERLWRLHQENPGLVSWNVDANSRLREISVPAPWRRPCGRSSAATPSVRASFPWWTAGPCSGSAARPPLACPSTSRPCRRSAARPRGAAPSSTARGRSSTSTSAGRWCGPPWSASAAGDHSAC